MFCSPLETRRLQITLASVGLDGRSQARGRLSRSNILAVEVNQEAGVGSASEVAGRSESVQHAVVAKVRVANLVGAGAGRGEDAAVDRALLNRVVDVLEDVALCDDLGAAADFESVALDLVPVVVDGVEESVAANLGSTSGSVVDVVVLHRHQII